MPCCGHPLTPFPSVCKESWQQEAHGHCQSRSASNPCNVHCLHPARHLIGAYVLPWHSHRAALALREQVNDWQEDSGYPLYKPQVLSSSHQTPGSPSGLWGDSSILPSTQGDKFRQRESLQCQGSVGIATAKPLCLASSPLHSPPDLFPAFQQSTAELGRVAVLAVLEENKCPVLAALLSRSSSGQPRISYRKDKWERGQKCPQAKQSSKRSKDRKVWSFQLGHHPFSISLPPLTPSSDPLCV